MSPNTRWFHEQTTEDARQERAFIRVWVGRVLFGLAALIAVVYLTKAYAAARVNDPQECALFTDYAVTTRALVVSGIEQKKRLEVLGNMYEMKDDRMRELARIVRTAADKSDLNVADFAGTVYKICLGTAGDISVLLGPSS